jgi:glutathione S-transferase
MLQIWGRLSSINVRKVVWCAQELGLAFQRTEAGGRFGVVQTPAYRALNPNALVPAIEDDDGVRLWESNVIVRYPVRPPRARPALPRAAGGAIRCRALDGLAADHAQPGRPRRVHAMGAHACRAARRRRGGAIGAGDRRAPRLARLAPGNALPT